MSSDYPPTMIPPWSHQKKVWNLAKDRNAFYIAHDMGAGKTKTFIDYANGIDAHSVIVICPKKIILQWGEQFLLNSFNPYAALLLDGKESVSRKANLLKHFIHTCQKSNTRYVVVINYESFWRPPMGPVYRDNKFHKPGQLTAYHWDLMALDEAHRIKTPSGKASWGAKRLARKATRKIWMSGTPMAHAPTDLYAQMRALDPTIFGTSYAKFKHRYCIMGGFEGKQVVDYINMKEFKQKFFSIAHYVKIDDVLDMPAKTDINVKCVLDKNTMKIYSELAEEFIAEYANGEITVSNALVKLLRLAQITGGCIQLDDEEGQRIIDSNKLDTLIEVVQDIPMDEPIVIFCRFTSELQRIHDSLKKMNRIPCEISGHKDEQKLFEDGAADVAVVQIQAGSEGLDNLKRARYCIYFSIGYSLGTYRQSRARVWRPGQTRKVFYYHILARNTVDIKIMQAIRSKKKIVDHVLSAIDDNKFLQATAIQDALGIFNS